MPNLQYDIIRDAVVMDSIYESSSLSSLATIGTNNQLTVKGQIIETGSFTKRMELTPAGNLWARYFIETTDPLLNGLVGWWKLDDGSGIDAADSSGYNHTASIKNTVIWTNDDRNTGNGAINFDGTASYGVTDMAGQDHLTSGTLSLWYKQKDLTIVYPFLAGNLNWSVDTDGFGIMKEGSNLSFYLANAGAYAQVTLGTLGVINTWHHVVATWNASAIKIFRDFATTASTVHAITPTFVSPFTIGKDPATNNYYWSGSLDDIRLYNRVLTDEEINTLYTTT